jgi:drug/metabolite transporter (DMT)-like permease
MLSNTRLAAAASLVGAMTLVGANVAFGKAIVAEVPVYLFLLFRFAVASVALAPLARGELGPRLAHMTGAEWRDLTLMALLGMVGFTAFMLEGVKRTDAADAGIITATLPAMVALLGLVLAGDRLSRLQATAVGLAVGGLLLVQSAGAARGGSTPLGNVLVGGAVLCEASFVILGKRLTPAYQPLRLALGANLVGLVLTLPLALPQVAGFDPLAVRPVLWLVGIWYVLAASVVSLWLWYRALPHVETWLAGLATAALPLAALAASAIFLGETIGWTKIEGAALVIAAIVLGAVSPARTR